MSARTYSLKSISNDRFLRNFLRQFYLLSKFLTEYCWRCLAWALSRDLMSNKLKTLPILRHRPILRFKNKWYGYTSLTKCKFLIKISVEEYTMVYNSCRIPKNFSYNALPLLPFHCCLFHSQKDLLEFTSDILLVLKSRCSLVGSVLVF